MGWGLLDPAHGYLIPHMTKFQGLTSHTDLNIHRVEVSNYNPDIGRYKAIIKENNQNMSLAIKPTNFVLDEGAKVVIRGLVSTNDLNGKHGEVTTFYDDLSRYAIRLCDGSNKEIGVKPDNAVAY